jgi:hypothetical protein
MSAKSSVDMNLWADVVVIENALNNLPRIFAQKFGKNVWPFTPKKYGPLRASIFAQSLGHTATVGWRMPYVLDQELGYNTKTGYVYSHWTTPGTGPHFAQMGVRMTLAQMDSIYREVGLTR